jgi:hypothetical protein
VTDWFLAVNGDDNNTGQSSENAFRRIARGVDHLDAGDRLFMGDGVYTEHVTIEGKNRVTIRSVPGEHAVIDGARDDFRAEPSQLWTPGDVDGEFVTLAAYPAHTDRGAFLDPYRHIRLIVRSARGSTGEQ